MIPKWKRSCGAFIFFKFKIIEKCFNIPLIPRTSFSIEITWLIVIFPGIGWSLQD